MGHLADRLYWPFSPIQRKAIHISTSRSPIQVSAGRSIRVWNGRKYSSSPKWMIQLLHKTLINPIRHWLPLYCQSCPRLGHRGRGQMDFSHPHYPQANRIVERTNGLLKRFLKPQNPGRATRIQKALTLVNSWWGKFGSPKITAFCPGPPTILPTPQGPDHPKTPLYYPSQPVLVKIPTVGDVPLVLDTLLNEYTWKAKHAVGTEGKIDTWWITPSF